MANPKLNAGSAKENAQMRQFGSSVIGAYDSAQARKSSCSVVGARGQSGPGFSKGFIYTLSTILIISSIVILAYQYSLESNMNSLAMRNVFPIETVSFAYDNFASNLRHMSLNSSYLSVQPNTTTWIYYHAGYSEFFSSGNSSATSALNCTGGKSTNPFVNLSASPAFANYLAYFIGRYANLSHASAQANISTSQFAANQKYFCADNMTAPATYNIPGGSNIRYYINQTSANITRHFFIFPGSSAVNAQSVQISCPANNLTGITTSLNNSSCGASCLNFRVAVVSANATVSQYANSSYQSALPKASFSFSGSGTVDVEFSNNWAGSTGVRVSFTNLLNCTYLIRTNMSDSPGTYSLYTTSPFTPIPLAAINFTLQSGFSKNSTTGGYG